MVFEPGIHELERVWVWCYKLMLPGQVCIWVCTISAPERWHV